MEKIPSYEQDQESISRKIREVNRPGGFYLPWFFRDRDFDKFEMQIVKTQRKEKEHTTVWAKTRIIIRIIQFVNVIFVLLKLVELWKLCPRVESRLRLQHADYGASTPPILSANVPYVIQNIFHKLPKPLMLATPYLSGLTRPKKLYMAANFAFLVGTI